jgi:carboxyl-terminal processing protease
LLQDLDPHSYYIPPEDFGEMNEPLEGNFDGIGVEFRIVEDTVVVISVISGGPSEKVGLMSGDRIIRVDSFDIAGIEINNSEVIKTKA